MGTRSAISAAALSAAIGLFNSNAFSQLRQADPPAPATQPAHDQTEIPVKQVVLFNSGVGYFEHGGSVTGDAVTELRFKTDQVNDILKSLLLQDMDGGTIGTVSYPGLAPLAHTLKSFQVDITANPDMADLLNQLRGAKITVMIETGPPAEKLTGVILGVEKKLQANGEKPAVEITKLNLKCGRLFRSINIEAIGSMELEDPALQKELDDALAALAHARDQDKKPMTLHFNGKGDRHVRIGYLAETPIWKTSYRLVLGSADAEKKPPVPASAPATGPATAPADAMNHAAKLQGWAIVENQTDNDWNDVQLSLVSGRPLSFIQDLYHSQYLPRPVVMAENYTSLRPQTYAGGIFNKKDLITNVPDFTDAPDFSLNATGGKQGVFGGGGGQSWKDAGGTAGLFGSMNNGATTQPQQGPIDPTASIVSAASAAKVGELFKYGIGHVSLARQTSAMIPIVTDDIDAERISIYNQGTLATHPLLGARLKNNTGKFLLQGPITVLDHGSYAGDARVEDLPPGQERLISFGIDQQLQIDPNEVKATSISVTGKIVKGMLIVTMRNVVEQTYVADNKSDDTRVLVIEHPRLAEYTLTSPAAAEETTPELFRFRRLLPAKKAAKLTVVQEHVSESPTQILALASANLIPFFQDNAIPKNVRDALAKAIALKDQIALDTSRITDMQHQADLLASDQSRIRDNLKAVSADSDYYKRLVKKIDEEETALEKLQKSIGDLLQTKQTTESQLTEFVTNLTIGQ